MKTKNEKRTTKKMEYTRFYDDIVARKAFADPDDGNVAWLCAAARANSEQHCQVGNSALAREEIVRWIARFYPGMEAFRP